MAAGRRVLNLYQTELHHIPEDSNLQWCMIFKSYTYMGPLMLISNIC